MLCVLEGTVNVCNLWLLIDRLFGGRTSFLLLVVALWMCTTILEFCMIVFWLAGGALSS